MNRLLSIVTLEATVIIYPLSIRGWLGIKHLSISGLTFKTIAIVEFIRNYDVQRS